MRLIQQQPRLSRPAFVEHKISLVAASPILKPIKVQLQPPRIAVSPILGKPTTPFIRAYAPTVGRLETDFSDDFFPEFRPDPYPDYARRFTEEGGVELVYKDIDESLPRTLGKIALWVLAMLTTAAYLHYASPLADAMSNCIGLIVMAVIYAFILSGVQHGSRVPRLSRE
jgi:hypothetical protein